MRGTYRIWGLSSNGAENLHKSRGLAAVDFWAGKCEIEALPAAVRDRPHGLQQTGVCWSTGPTLCLA